MLFKDVMVDTTLKQQLVHLVKENRISHTQLFLAQPGSHSFALAVAYAQYLCCENKGESDSCGVCPSCVKFEKLSHPDFHLIFPNCIAKNVKKDPDSKQFAQEFKDFVFEKNYHIDINDWLTRLGCENKQATINIRDCANIISQNSIRSYEGGYKIYILWMVERLHHAAAPKLLKTLEEPENKTLFILLSENPDKILSTILSRTQLVKIPRIEKEAIQNQLLHDFEISEQQAGDIAAISEGNYVRAMELFHESGEQKEMLRDFETILNSMIAASKNQSLDQIGFLDVQDIFFAIISKGREHQKNFIKFMIRIFRNVLLENTGNQTVIKATEAEKKLIRSVSDYITLKKAGIIFNECNHAIYHIERNGNASIIFTDLYLKISQALGEGK